MRDYYPALDITMWHTCDDPNEC